MNKLLEEVRQAPAAPRGVVPAVSRILLAQASAPLRRALGVAPADRASLRAFCKAFRCAFPAEDQVQKAIHQPANRLAADGCRAQAAVPTRHCGRGEHTQNYNHLSSTCLLSWSH